MPWKKSIIYWCVFDLDAKVVELAKLSKKTEQVDFWQDSDTAQSVMKNMSALRDEVDYWEKLQSRINDALELVEIGDNQLKEELEIEIGSLETEISLREFETMLSGKHDPGDAILAIHAGT